MVHEAMRSYVRVVGRLLVANAELTRKGELAEQLQLALDRRIVLERAKGLLMERKGLTAAQAFNLIRALARSSERTVNEVAAELLHKVRP